MRRDKQDNVYLWELFALFRVTLIVYGLNRWIRGQDASIAVAVISAMGARLAFIVLAKPPEKAS